MEVQNRVKEINADIDVFFEKLESLGCFDKFNTDQKSIIKIDLKNLVLNSINEAQGIMNDLYYRLKN